MQTEAHTQRLELAERFTIARGSADVQTVAVLELRHAGIHAHGEGAPVSYWGEDADRIVEALSADAGTLLGKDPWATERIAARVRAWDGPQGAKMALAGALYDWLGKRVEQPTWRMLGVGRRTPPTSYTIGIDSLEGTIERVRRAAEFEILKVKVGAAEDAERLRAIRAMTPQRLRIDANEGWTLATLRELTPLLLELGVEWVEQPFPAADVESYLSYRRLTPRLPVLIDEGCRDLASIAAIARYADGIVIKLAKCGGIHEGLRMIHAARAFGLRIMVGCMLESQLGIAQGALVAALADAADLDGHLLLRESPYTGLEVAGGRLLLTTAPGLGARRRR